MILNREEMLGAGWRWITFLCLSGLVHYLHEDIDAAEKNVDLIFDVILSHPKLYDTQVVSDLWQVDCDVCHLTGKNMANYSPSLAVYAAHMIWPATPADTASLQDTPASVEARGGQQMQVVGNLQPPFLQGTLKLGKAQGTLQEGRAPCIAHPVTWS